jgi:alkylation response protein AidB-like acyl-CoA dehydrogenase
MPPAARFCCSSSRPRFGNIAHHGSREQQERWLPRIASGELRIALVITEEHAGVWRFRYTESG